MPRPSTVRSAIDPSALRQHLRDSPVHAPSFKYGFIFWQRRGLRAASARRRSMLHLSIVTVADVSVRGLGRPTKLPHSAEEHVCAKDGDGFEDEVAAARRTERVSMRSIAGVAGRCRMRSSASAVVDVPAVLRADATERSWDFSARLSQRFLWIADIAFRGSISGHVERAPLRTAKLPEHIFLRSKWPSRLGAIFFHDETIILCHRNSKLCG